MRTVVGAGAGAVSTTTSGSGLGEGTSVGGFELQQVRSVDLQTVQ